jgi:DNA 3'-phosphatase
MSLLKFTLVSVFIFLSAGQLPAQELHRQQFLSQDFQHEGGVNVAFFDADSTLRVSKEGTPSANGPHDYLILPGVKEEIRRLNHQGYLVVIVSNQAGIPKYISLKDADSAIFNMIQDLKAEGAIVHYYDFAENRDDHRKPGTGMARDLQARLVESLGKSGSINKAKSFMVGDASYKRAINGEPGETRPDGRLGFNVSNSDRLFAENFGIKFYEPQDFFGWKKYGVELIESKEHLQELKRRISGGGACQQILGN